MELFIFIFGLILGSFYNVVGIRLLKKESIVKPGSHCPKCKTFLSWYENIPVLSYIFLKGKCKHCGESISRIYPTMELLTGLLFLFSYLLYGLTPEFFISLVISSLIVIIFITDTKEMIILDESILVSGTLILIINILFFGIKAALVSLLSGLGIFAIMYVLMIMGNNIFKKESLGGGDIKLSFVAGMTLGFPLGIFYIVLASFLAFPYALYVSIKNKANMLPFGPFLAVSIFITYTNQALIIEILKVLLKI